MVVYFYLLEVLGDTAAIKNRLLYYLSNILLLILDHNSGPVISTQRTVGQSNPFIRSMLIVVLPRHLPGPVRRRQQESMKEIHILLEVQVDIPTFSIGLISRRKLVLIGKITRHEGKTNGRRDRQCVVTIFEGVVDLRNHEVPVLLKPTPVEHHLADTLIL